MTDCEILQLRLNVQLLCSIFIDCLDSGNPANTLWALRKLVLSDRNLRDVLVKIGRVQGYESRQHPKLMAALDSCCGIVFVEKKPWTSGPWFRWFRWFRCCRRKTA
jgi:hypothetical protein